jgi:hypothetical protein
MKLIHKVEECAVYESNKQSYASISSSSSSSSLPQVKTFLLKITSSNTPEAAVALLSILAKSVKRAHTDGAYNHTSTSIKFKALKVIPLKPFIDNMHLPLPSPSPSPSPSPYSNMSGMAYTLTLKLLADVGTQLERIRVEHGLIIPFLSFEDIVVIETRSHNQDNQDNQDKQEEEEEPNDPKTEYTFVFMNAEKLVKKSNKKELIIDMPLKVNKHTSFLPVELPESALKRLPMRFTTTSWQYSLSALCIYALLQHKFKNGEDDIERIGRPFLHTSLYFCLKRCLKPDPEERVLLYV